ncbi:type 1 fimbrial protein [Yersinia massiliensis]|jgi:minor fimbrial subunit|uniref:Type 1 fimbrial protein n=2 Tax=Yersinia TaxID=629 RepID=A0A2R4NRX7_9GAMM|nr:MULTISPECIES: fimbrial protein [Yersinia]HEC1651558.1 type 1 fimbrial protein [Yersinia enterocolitica]ATM85288.1 type 1 fimbrial protein [Yersinia frederiksenii]AVX38864.1 type 1 fimbrial protein [Yersinia massiliensis]MCB5316237.1 type 1 fimbrial protein [Yersinia massiliensis]MDA5549777.1 fimbrial protein [Yersinia massiliensis]
MRKKLYILCLLALFSTRVTQAADSTISISGYVKDNACSVAPGSQSFVVDLLSHAAKQLHRVGATTPRVLFSIVLDNCSAIAVKTGFTGGADSDNLSLLKIDSGAGAAAGMGIQILDNNGNAIALNETSSGLNWSSITTGQSNTLYFYARLMATRAQVTAGQVSATANFTLEFQ